MNVPVVAMGLGGCVAPEMIGRSGPGECLGDLARGLLLSQGRKEQILGVICMVCLVG